MVLPTHGGGHRISARMAKEGRFYINYKIFCHGNGTLLGVYQKFVGDSEKSQDCQPMVWHGNWAVGGFRDRLQRFQHCLRFAVGPHRQVRTYLIRVNEWKLALVHRLNLRKNTIGTWEWSHLVLQMIRYRNDWDESTLELGRTKGKNLRIWRTWDAVTAWKNHGPKKGRQFAEISFWEQLSTFVPRPQ